MYDEEEIDRMIEGFHRGGFNHSPIAIAIDTFTHLMKAGVSEQAALKLTKVVCDNYYKACFNHYFEGLCREEGK